MDRSERELVTLEKISQILGDGLELEEVFGRAMAVLSDRMGIQRAALVLLDRASEGLRTVAAVGLTAAERDRGRYAVGEGVTGRVLETGEAAVIPDIARAPEFLNKTGSRSLGKTAGGGKGESAGAGGGGGEAVGGAGDEETVMAFICVPIQDGERDVGTISVDIPNLGEEDLHAKARLLRIIAGSFAQSVRLHDRVRLQKDQWLAENQQLRENLRSKYQFDNIIGTSPVMLDVLATIAQVATSRATVLILGETGCGKELIAKAIHYNSPRRDKPMVRINCGALAAQLLESELFGHVKGAFTGAVRDKIGRFEAADGGTLFLDEVGTLDPQLQVKLLRVLQEREFERVGDHRSVSVDVRIIAATNLNLEDEVRNGSFREDLFYRLNVVTLHLPPLRARREDIPLLIDHFLDQYNKENDRNLRSITREVMHTLLRYPWPGNVRELENMVERAVVLSTGDELTQDLLPLGVRLFGQQTRGPGGGDTIEGLCSRLADLAVRLLSESHPGQVYDAVIQQVERQLLRESLAYNDGVKTRTADYLGINRNTLNKKVKDLGIEEGGEE